MIPSLGIFAVAVAFIFAVISATAYLLYYKDKQDNLLRLANISFMVMGGGIVLAILLLIYAIQTHDFQINYVYNYSSRALNPFYLFATLWAGQEGTFLMWLTFGSIFGLILIKGIAKKNPLVLFFLAVVQCFLLLILLKKNPFAMIWHIHEEAAIGFMPQDGRGLNPLLQNFWMVIHPPTLFLGYSSTVVAYVFAMSAMVTRDFHGWVKQARSWVVFNVMVLGTGVIMGGYWAYTTLGWGGYWGWDPVENASVVPWLFSIVLLHGMVIQSKRKSLVRSNFLWAGLSFLSMLWGSYLTRSGVLTDFSVHSFGASGLNFYLALIQVVFTGGFFYMLFNFMKYYQREGCRPVEFGKGILNRETFMFFGMMVVLFIALFTLFGTSAPIYTQWFGQAASLSPDFYNTMIIPVTIFMFFAMGIAPLLAWKTAELRNKNTIIIAAAAALLITIVAVFLGLSSMESIGEHTPYYAIKGTIVPGIIMAIREFLFDSLLKYSPYVLFFLSAFVIIINLKLSLLFIKNNAVKAGGYIVHVGFGFMLIGVLTSSVYDSSQKLMLSQGEFHETVFGHQVRFEKFIEMPDGRDQVMLTVKTAYGNTYQAYPQFYYSDYSQAYMVAPDVRIEFAKDIYISPISFTPAKLANSQELELSKTQTKNFGDMQITFNKFLVKMGAGSQEVTADLTFIINENGYPKEYSLQPILIAKNGQMNSSEVAVPGTSFKVKIASVNASAGSLKLAILSSAQGGDTPKDMLAIEMSEKPFISALWFGTLIFIAGSFLTLMNRVESKKS